MPNPVSVELRIALPELSEPTFALIGANGDATVDAEEPPPAGVFFEKDKGILLFRNTPAGGI